MTKKIPITAITGFLGSGKTTLVNYILEHNEGRKIGVVVNDYGAINIDAELISALTDDTLELTNGCMCCSLESVELDEAIAQFVTPGSEMDYIIIEASGLAEPADLAIKLRDAAGTHARLDSVVTVLDAVNFDNSNDHRATMTAHIEHGDFVVINKVDLVSTAQLKRITAFAKKVNPRIRIFEAQHGRIDVRLLLDQDTHEPNASTADHDHTSHLHNDYQTISFSSPKPLDPATFQNFVNEQIPAEVYRAKGIVNMGKKGQDRKYIFQLVGKRAEITWSEWNSQEPKTELVFIGKNFDTTKLLGQASACIDSNPSNHTLEKPIVLRRREL